MNNKEALSLLETKTLRSATQTFQFEIIWSKFRSLNPERDYFRKKADLLTWEQMDFYSLPTNSPHKKRLSHDNTTIEIDLSHESKKNYRN